MLLNNTGIMNTSYTFDFHVSFLKQKPEYIALLLLNATVCVFLCVFVLFSLSWIRTVYRTLNNLHP